MRSIERVFNKVKGRNPSLGIYPCLIQAIKHKKFSRKSLVKAFKKLVPQEDYEQEQTKPLIDYLEQCSNLLEEVEI